MSDKGSAYVAHAYRAALPELGLRHLRIRTYRPRTNVKAERFVQTLLNEWAYERIYRGSTERTAALPVFLRRYNFSQPHGSLGHRPPGSRLTKVVGSYSSGGAGRKCLEVKLGTVALRGRLAASYGDALREKADAARHALVDAHAHEHHGERVDDPGHRSDARNQSGRGTRA